MHRGSQLWVLTVYNEAYQYASCWMDIWVLFYCCGGWSLVHICRLQKQNLSIVMSWKHYCGNETLWLPSCNLQSSNSSPLWPSIPLFLSNHIRIMLICLIETKGTWVVSWKLLPLFVMMEWNVASHADKKQLLRHLWCLVTSYKMKRLNWRRYISFNKGHPDAIWSIKLGLHFSFHDSLTKEYS